MQRVAGFVFTGGRSSRMKQDKARLPIGSKCLVELVAGAVREAAGNVTLVGRPEAFVDLPFECLADQRPGLGPLSGLETALASERGELNLVASCDTPELKGTDLARLLVVAMQNNALCTLTTDANQKRHPLCAVYKREVLPFVRSALDAGHLRLLALVEELKAEEVRIDSVLHNLNTPEQWAAWKAAQPV